MDTDIFAQIQHFSFHIILIQIEINKKCPLILNTWPKSSLRKKTVRFQISLSQNIKMWPKSIGSWTWNPTRGDFSFQGKKV